MCLRTCTLSGVFPQRTRVAIATMELALIAPVLVLIALGMFELSRGMMVKQILTGAARKGCRTGIIHQYGNSDIINDATNVMQDNGFNSTLFNPPTLGAVNITVTDPNGHPLSDALDAPPGSTVFVQVVIPTTSVNWVTSFYLPSNKVESDVVVMMKQ